MINADRSSGANACKAQVPRASTAANDGKGVIRWVMAPGQVFPCMLDVHAALLFDGPMATEQLDADGIAVAGCM